MLDLKGKHAIVTGGGTGIGRSIALHLAKEGCHLILTGLGEDDLNRVKVECEALGVKAWAKETRLDDYRSIDAFYDYVTGLDVNIDLFVLNAGISQREKALDTDISVDEKILKVDFLSGVYLVKKFGDMIKASEHVQLSSTPRSARAPCTAMARPMPRWTRDRPTVSMWTAAAPSLLGPSNAKSTVNLSARRNY